MPSPPVGSYFIISRLAYVGSLLAVTYTGENSALTVDEFANLPTQAWNISNVQVKNGMMQTLSPVDAPNLQIGYFSSNTITTVAGNSNWTYVWSVMGEDGIYTIQDGNYVNFWGIQAAQVGETITCSTGTGDEGQNWELISAD